MARKFHFWLSHGLLLGLWLAPLPASGQDLSQPATWQVQDTFKPKADASEAANLMLKEMAWPVQEFTVRLDPPEAGTTDADAMLRFASPRPQGDLADPANTVVLEWFLAEGPGSAATPKGPAVVVLDILDGSLTIARAVARGFSQRGIHAFAMHNPGHGPRRGAADRRDPSAFFLGNAQAVSDARRARDAVAVLPRIDAAHISLQGTSLGGFLATMVSASDGAFDQTFILLAGADLYGMFQTGQRDTANIRRAAERAGITDELLRSLCARIEPATLAHRLDPARTWLFSADADEVVPPANARALAAAGHLTGDHHRWLSGGHYTCIIHLPWTLDEMSRLIKAAGPKQPPSP